MTEYFQLSVGAVILIASITVVVKGIAVSALVAGLVLAFIATFLLAVNTGTSDSTTEMEKTDIRITLVGKTGVGKSAVGNTILRRDAFVSQLCSSSTTAVCQKETGECKGFKLTVIDTPGLYDTKKSNDEVVKEVGKSISLSSPGPHAILIVIQAGRYTREEEETVKILRKLFGEQAENFMMVVFTQGDQLKRCGISIEKMIQGSSICGVIEQCKGGYHVLDNTVRNDKQVSELMQKINTMMQKNKGMFYTNEMFAEVERAIKAKTAHLRKANPNMDVKAARSAAELDNDFIWKLVTQFFNAVLDAAGGTEAIMTSIVSSLQEVVEDSCVIQ